MFSELAICLNPKACHNLVRSSYSGLAHESSALLQKSQTQVHYAHILRQQSCPPRHSYIVCSSLSKQTTHSLLFLLATFTCS